MLLKELTQYWLDNIVMFECKHSTFRTYQSIVSNYIDNNIGNKLITEFSYEDGIKFRRDLIDMNLSDSTINKILNCLKVIFNRSIDLQYITINPISKLKFIKLAPSNVKPLTANEIVKFKGINSQFKSVYMLALYTGLRLGEIAGLRHCDIDINNELIMVTRNKTREGITTPKSNKNRIIPIHPKCVEYFKDIINNTEELLFDIDINNFTNTILKRDCKNNNIRCIRFHDFRHTFATEYIKGGGKITHLSKILGHSNVNITMDKYVKIDSDSLLTDITRLDI